ncbi:Polysaccharide deacetylase [Candidatus Filomicrobium marinum]|uniref:Chitooligosaccharide deacetylase n=1 Tax=Candidatus Filomicrobium marinum TaxID=1608628 RepID=A0A0D6JFW6_9HYPH|nr:polysaccharide deacetylase family protein [Candidatus Filomicrobium marinum]CFX22920.1 Polysaccharide deacetylase [Candidatus Filomicrobium marinum]CPR18974.1 Polysaccharide deacetylase [Candidatus Filomicrobium marinum]
MKSARRPALTCVCYHDIAARESAATAGLGITTTPTTFAEHLDYLTSRYNVVGLDAILAGELPERPLLITFDDAYRSVLTNAAPMLAERRLPAVMFANARPIRDAFVPPENMLALSAAQWGIDDLSRLVSNGRFEAETLLDLIGGYASRLAPTELQDMSAVILAKLGQTQAQLHRDLGLFLEPDDLKRLADFGIEIGNHTRSHVRCRALDARELNSEIVSAKDELEEMSGRTVRGFSFPWGHEDDATPEALAAIRSSDHRGIFLVHARHNSERPAKDIWYRVVMTNESVQQLPWVLSIKPRLRSLVQRWRRGREDGARMKQRA